MPLHLVREREGGRQGGLRWTWSLIPICTLLAPAPSLRWAMGFSLREGNGFWPETTEPLSLFRLASPLPIRSSDMYLGWKGVVQAPFPSGQAAQTGSHPLCALLGNKPEWGGGGIALDPHVSLPPSLTPVGGGCGCQDSIDCWVPSAVCASEQIIIIIIVTQCSQLGHLLSARPSATSFTFSLYGSYEEGIILSPF